MRTETLVEKLIKTYIGQIHVSDFWKLTEIVEVVVESLPPI